jgi:uncharacterized protein YacL
MEKHTEEEFFKEIMSKSKLEMPFSDFEDEVMMQIREREVYQRSYVKDLKLSWIFFIAGSIFGLILSFLLPEVLPQIVNINPAVFAQALQVIIVLWILIQLDSLIDFSRKRGFMSSKKMETTNNQK